MSKATADSSDEQASRAFDLSDEIYIKLAQAYGCLRRNSPGPGQERGPRG